MTMCYFPYLYIFNPSDLVRIFPYIYIYIAWWLSYKEGMKPVVADKQPCYQIYIKTMYLFIIIW